MPCRSSAWRCPGSALLAVAACRGNQHLYECAHPIRLHCRVAGSTGTSSAAASMFVPTESEAFRVDADGQERPYVRFALEGLSGEMVPGRQ